jgi:hypothetical protein
MSDHWAALTIGDKHILRAERDAKATTFAPSAKDGHKTAGADASRFLLSR